MDAVDGNAIGGLLIDVFGTEMTAANSTCATCGASRPVAELVVYQRAPGTVVRCRSCGSVLMVLVRHRNAIAVDLSGLANLEPAGIGLIGAGGLRTRLHVKTSRQISKQISKRKGINMSHEQSMSMSDEPQEESMSMGEPGEESTSMGEPGEESMSMGEPGEESTSMGQPGEESTSMGQPDEDSM